jgi:chromate transporter
MSQATGRRPTYKDAREGRQPLSVDALCGYARDREPAAGSVMTERWQRLAEVASAFHRLGWTAFGGPAAHFAYYRDAFVLRRHWLDEHAYAELLALVQLLPGPASSQLAVTLGIGRAGLLGGLVAWLGFTLPSALLMLGFAQLVLELGAVHDQSWLRGLKVAVVGVVAQAVLSMAGRLCPDWPRRAIAGLGTLGALLLSGSSGQLLVIGLGGAIGFGWLRSRVAIASEAPAFGRIGRGSALLCLALFAGLLLGLPLLRAAVPSSVVIAWIDSFYRAGALVFGGGHVVLPLLQAAVVQPGWISPDLFLAGYGAAQAVPGPVFTFAAYLGAAMTGPVAPAAGAAICLVALFLPSMLLLVGVLPFWAVVRGLPGMAPALAGVGAAVVGLLLAALIDPIWPSAIREPGDVALAALVFALLRWGRLPPWAIVLGCAALGALLAHIPG